MNAFEKIFTNPKYLQIYKKINPILFDVTLRDGIQTLKPENFPFSKKMDLLHQLISFQYLRNIEIGSLSSPKYLPIMNDTLPLHNITTQYFQFMQHTRGENDLYKKNIYVLIPSISKLETAIQNDVCNFSFITSISNIFQARNTNKTIQETKTDFKIAFDRLNREPSQKKYKKKLYISCIDCCPIMGKIGNDYIVDEILYYNNNYDFDELCLSDTCGKLIFSNFRYIIEKSRLMGVSLTKFSLHLHISSENMENIEQILFYCFENNIHKFDVTLIETGGCPMTIHPDDLLPNLSYDLFFSILLNYITKFSKTGN
jgi:isopropylmalate/homocitrate/citramalate synthase